jgi:hypothetical protein
MSVADQIIHRVLGRASPTTGERKSENDTAIESYTGKRILRWDQI